MTAATTTKKTTTEKAEDAVAAVEEANGAAPGKLAGKKETLQQLKNRLRNEAEREVLNTHKDEVIAITGAKYEAHGLEYVRRLTDQEKAAKAIEDYYNQFPELRTQFAPAPAPDADTFVEAREGE